MVTMTSFVGTSLVIEKINWIEKARKSFSFTWAFTLQTRKIVLLKLIRTIARIYNATDKNIQDWVVLTGDRDRVRVIIIIIIIIIINVNVKIP